jgi:predicted P-loop ATPase/GTPase
MPNIQIPTSNPKAAVLFFRDKFQVALSASSMRPFSAHAHRVLQYARPQNCIRMRIHVYATILGKYTLGCEDRYTPSPEAC